MEELKMVKSRLKILFCITVVLAFLLAPLATDFFGDGKAYAFTSKKRNKAEYTQGQGYGEGKKPSWANYETPKGTDSHTKAPEPATMILVVAGLGGLLILRKKFKK